MLGGKRTNGGQPSEGEKGGGGRLRNSDPIRGFVLSWLAYRVSQGFVTTVLCSGGGLVGVVALCLDTVLHTVQRTSLCGRCWQSCRRSLVLSTSERHAP